MEVRQAASKCIADNSWRSAVVSNAVIITLNACRVQCYRHGCGYIWECSGQADQWTPGVPITLARHLNMCLSTSLLVHALTPMPLVT